MYYSSTKCKPFELKIDSMKPHDVENYSVIVYLCHNCHLNVKSA